MTEESLWALVTLGADTERNNTFTRLFVRASSVYCAKRVRTCMDPTSIMLEGLIDWLIDYLFAQTCYKTAQVMATEHEQDSQAPSALIAALIA